MGKLISAEVRSASRMVVSFNIGLPSSVTATAPAHCKARKSVSTAPLLACVAEATGNTFTTARRGGCRTHVTHSGESSTGVVFGMQHTVVNPPAAAAAVPDAIVSL